MIAAAVKIDEHFALSSYSPAIRRGSLRRPTKQNRLTSEDRYRKMCRVATFDGATRTAQGKGLVLTTEPSGSITMSQTGLS